MVCYCSRTCQKAAWKTHKKSCATTANLRAQMEADEDVRELNNDLSTWLGYWRAHLHMFSLSALDLANHPPDRLATHCMVVTLEYRPNPPSRAQIFRVAKGEVMSRQEFVELMQEHEGTEEDIKDWVEDIRGDHTMEICVVCEGAMRFLFFSLRDLSPYRDMDKAASLRLADTWAEALTTLVEAGDTSNMARMGIGL